MNFVTDDKNICEARQRWNVQYEEGWRGFDGNFDDMVPYEWAFDDINALQYLLQCVI